MPAGLPLESQATLPTLLFAGAFLISAFTLLRKVDPFDEGLALQAARRVAEGELPYRDFMWPYGPADPYLLAGLFKTAGTSLIWWRVQRSLADAAIAVLVYALARRARAPRSLALLGWLTAACAMAQPTSANPMAPALAFALAALLAASRSSDRRGIALTCLLTALTAAWRLDFGIYTAIACAVLLALRDGGRAAYSYAAGSAGAGALVYLPFAIAVGPADLYEAVVGRTLRESSYWRLPFPLTYDGRLRVWPPYDLLHDLKDVLLFYVPLILVAGLALAACVLVLRFTRERRSAPALPVALGVLSACFGLYLRSRTDELHTQPLIVALAALLPALIAWLWRTYRPLSGPWAVGLLGGLIVALLLANGAANRLSALLRPPGLVSIDVPVAHGAKETPAEARSLARVVRLVQQRVPPGGYIYVAPRRSDLVTLQNPLLYVLTERENPLREDVGLKTSAADQAGIVARLEQTRPRVIVRWTSPESSRPEPNRRGRSSGVRTLDAWIGGNYRLLERDGYYDVLVPR
ncbi:MAG: hypothetical protein IRZ21_07440 [Thermoleophilaceae bacterium]|nr:hypothetical protein [Thermoleophilaceae bacterium]